MAEERKIKGFGAKAGGKKLIHIVCEDGGAICDKRLTGFGKVHTFLTMVTCPKCSNYSAYKALMISFKEGDDLEEIKKILKETHDKKKKETPPVPKKKEPVKKEPVKKEPVKKEPVKKEPVYPPKGPLEKEKGKEEKALPKKQEDWNLLWSKDKTSCDILHKPTQKVLFENLQNNIAMAALDNLNKMKIFWFSEKDTVPKDFVSTIRSIIGKAYKKTGNKIPENLIKPITTKKKKKKEKEKPPARTIKRRAKVERRVIKRRSSDNEVETKRVIKRRSKETKKDVHIITEIFGRREGTPGFTIIQLLDEGTSIQDMINTLVKKHSLTERKAKAKIKGVIRKTARKQGIPIVIELMEDDGDDIYGLRYDLDVRP